MKDRTGLENKTYIYNGHQIEEFNTFLYEVTVYKCCKNQYVLLESRFLVSDKLLDEIIIRQKKEDYIIDKSIVLVGAPFPFILENRLPEYIKKKKNETKRRNSTR